MTEDGNRVLPKRYGLLKGQIRTTKDFDAPLELADVGMSDTRDVDCGGPLESSSLTPDNSTQQ